ncbi:hypothetical protein os4_19890 [Comamonadaceae bacterium OS-4]|nr:hypothetical protein os4_19890 [Comamonadaceae bacterium OS-4]
MSEASSGTAEQGSVVTNSLPSAGEMLRNAREAAGLHIAALAVSMKVPVKKLEALESDRIDLLPDAVFVRALASSVCRALKIDPAPILERLPHVVAPQFQVADRGINEPFRDQQNWVKSSVLDILKKPSALLVLGLLTCAVLVFAIPSLQLPGWLTASEAEPTELMPPADSVPGVNAPKQEPNDKAVGVEVVPSAGVNLQSSPTPAAAVAPEPIVPASGSQTGEDLLLVRAKGTTWIQVVDANGAVLMRKTLQGGTTSAVNGTPPLAVVVGKADLAEVEVRGKPFVMTDVSKDNVARFEVK